MDEITTDDAMEILEREPVAPDLHSGPFARPGLDVHGPSQTSGPGPHVGQAHPVPDGQNYVSNVLAKMGMSRRSEAPAYVARVKAEKEGSDLPESWS